MPILKEWKCLDCGTFFESASSEPECPDCAAPEPERAFLTPPGIKSPSTAVKDDMVKGLAGDFGLSNISNKHGQPVLKRPDQNQAPPDLRPRFAPADQIQNMKMGGGADNFSPVLGSLRNAGGPHTWKRERG